MIQIYTYIYLYIYIYIIYIWTDKKKLDFGVALSFGQPPWCDDFFEFFVRWFDRKDGSGSSSAPNSRTGCASAEMASPMKRYWSCPKNKKLIKQMANNHQSIKSKTCTNYIKTISKTISDNLTASWIFQSLLRSWHLGGSMLRRSFFRIRKCRKPPRIQIGIGWDRWVTPLASWGHLGVRLLWCTVLISFGQRSDLGSPTSYGSVT
jgi:hypothetical protein